jgi:hypothetical protein
MKILAIGKCFAMSSSKDGKKISGRFNSTQDSKKEGEGKIIVFTK